MKIFVLFFGLILSTVLASEINGQTKYANYEEAKKASSLFFTVNNTKAGLFSSDIYGYVLEYQYKAFYDQKNNILKDVQLSFPVSSMSTDNSSRDEKLHNFCLAKEKHPQIIVQIPGPVFLKDKREVAFQGTANLRGDNKPFSIQINSHVSPQFLTIKGRSVWSLKDMGIPDPSILVATLSDQIRLEINIDHPLP